MGDMPWGFREVKETRIYEHNYIPYTECRKCEHHLENVHNGQSVVCDKKGSRVIVLIMPRKHTGELAVDCI